MDENRSLTTRTVWSRGGSLMHEVTLLQDNAILQQNVMDTDALCSLLQNAVYKPEAATVCPVTPTPSGFVDGFVTEKKGSLGAVFFIEPQKHQFVLSYKDKKGKQGRKSYFLPMPGLVYKAIFGEGKKRAFTCYSFREWDGDDTRLCHYPFGNVSNSGDVCMGSVHTRAVETFADIREYIEMSLLGVTNGDYLGSGDTMRLLSTFSQYDFCEKYKEEEEFPAELLIDMEDCYITTVGELRKDLYRTAKSLSL